MNAKTKTNQDQSILMKMANRNVGPLLLGEIANVVTLLEEYKQQLFEMQQSVEAKEQKYSMYPPHQILAPEEICKWLGIGKSAAIKLLKEGDIVPFKSPINERGKWSALARNVYEYIDRVDQKRKELRGFI